MSPLARIPGNAARFGDLVEPPLVSPTRGQPTEWHELVQAHGDGDVVQDSPDELPAIDINAR